MEHTVGQVPMDPTTGAVHGFLVAMGPVRDALSDLLRHVNRRPEVAHAQVVPMEAELSPSFGLTADLRNGSTVDFWIDLDLRRPVWELEVNVLWHDVDEDGSHPVVRFPDQTIRSALELPPALVAAVASLKAASDADDLYR